MTRIHCRTRSFITAIVILPLTGCAQPFGFLNGAREEVIEVGTPTNVLTCAQAPAAARPDTQSVGPAGGPLLAGSSGVTIPPSALAQTHRFVVREVDGGRVGVDIEPLNDERKVRFAPNRSALLTIDVSRCTSAELGSREWFVWRLSQGRGESQKLATNMAARRLMAQIDSTSLFIIAD